MLITIAHQNPYPQPELHRTGHYFHHIFERDNTDFNDVTAFFYIWEIVAIVKTILKIFEGIFD